MLKQELTRQRFQLKRLAILSIALIVLLLGVSISGAIDSDLRRFGAISGTVVEARSGEAIPLVEIQIWNERGEYYEAALTDMKGAFSVEGLSPGRYYAATVESGFVDLLYDGEPCPIGECDPRAGTPIEVDAGDFTSGVDFILSR